MIKYVEHNLGSFFLIMSNNIFDHILIHLQCKRCKLVGIFDELYFFFWIKVDNIV